MWIVCYVDDSPEVPSISFSENNLQKKKIVVYYNFA